MEHTLRSFIGVKQQSALVVTLGIRSSTCPVNALSVNTNEHGLAIIRTYTANRLLPSVLLTRYFCHVAIVFQHIESTGESTQPYFVVQRVVVATLYVVGCYFLHLGRSGGRCRCHIDPIASTEQQLFFSPDDAVGADSLDNHCGFLVIYQVNSIVGSHPDALSGGADVVQLHYACNQQADVYLLTELVSRRIVYGNETLIVKGIQLL